jgi:hypothetical protein
MESAGIRITRLIKKVAKYEVGLIENWK